MDCVPGIPSFIKIQSESSSWLAWRKYRPSVQRAAFSLVKTAVPAEPVKPETWGRRLSTGAVYSLTSLQIDQGKKNVELKKYKFLRVPEPWASSVCWMNASTWPRFFLAAASNVIFLENTPFNLSIYRVLIQSKLQKSLENNHIFTTDRYAEKNS